ncbi:hypothetical protein AcW1_008280 [Taiwanofungus camphoratus]|nr:hypothetical protein AcV5_008575 [Antrodia cinnamomea]KAI0951169.1 hypothetical protein AcW1_008280 [Antrodia cinnamomea]KAI0956055.1 hypothetical protein AcV7_006563 [Antrodia cinnamomea]
MKYFASAVAFVSLVPVVLGQSKLTVNTITSGIVECEPTLFSWSGGQAPYYLSLVPAEQTSAPAIKQFAAQQGTSYTWNTDLASGTSFTIVLKDSTGDTAFSDVETITAGTSNSCLNTSVTESGGSGSAAPTSAGPTSAAGSTGGAAASSPTSSAPSSSATHPSGTGSAAGASSTSNAASRGSSTGAFGIAALMGLVGAALF